MGQILGPARKLASQLTSVGGALASQIEQKAKARGASDSRRAEAKQAGEAERQAGDEDRRRGKRAGRNLSGSCEVGCGRERRRSVDAKRGWSNATRFVTTSSVSVADGA